MSGKGPYVMSNSQSAICLRDRQNRLLKGGVTASLSGSARMPFRVWARVWFCLLAIAPGASAAGTDTLTIASTSGSPSHGVNAALVVNPGGASGFPSRVGLFRSGFYWLEDVDGNQQFNQPPDQAFAFGGIAGDIPITGDWNGDGRTKVGIYRPSNGLFILDSNGDQQFDAGDAIYNLGVGTQAGDVPVVGDWNGDGRTKVGLFRQGFSWILDYNGNGVFEQGIDKTYAFGGQAGDVPVVGDWTGTGTSKIGLVRQGFFWILDANGNGTFDGTGTGQDLAFPFGGVAGDRPVVGDWNGDGTSKVGVFRQGFFWVLDANGNHQLDGTGPGQDLAFAFGGISGDMPVVGKWSSAIITATSGTPQTTQINTAFAAPLAARLTNLGGSPLAGVLVTFAAPTSGASGTFAGGGTTAMASTNASGVATSPTFTANGTSGTYGVTASASGVGSPATFSLTNLTVSAPVKVALTPLSVSLQPSQNQTFTATVSGTSNTGVTWSVSPNLGGLAGSASTLVYFAPNTAPTTQTVTITATSMADPSKTATAVITLLQAITVSLSPSTASLTPSGTQQFTPTVLGTNQTAVTWSINPSAGTISSLGLYMAPPGILTSQTVTVTAQSVTDSTKSASATISLSPPATGAFTYYVDSTSGLDSNPGTQAAPWRTIAKVNSTTLLPGQSVAFKAGDVWREQLTIWSSGSVGEPITFTSYGSGPSPVISGANVVSAWTSAPPYYASYTTAPSQVFRNGARLNQVSSRSALLTGTWWLETADSRIYVYDDPSGKTMEASQRSYGVEIGGSYVTINGLNVRDANDEGIGIFTGSNHASVINCSVSNSYTNGIAVWSATPSISYGVIQGNTVSNSGSNGITITQDATYWIISNNTVYGNSSIPAVNAYTAGIDITSSSVSNVTIQNNEVYSNGLGQPTNIGFGIHVDDQPTNNLIGYNTAYGNNDCNILVEISENNQIYYNVVYGSIQGCGIGVRGASGTPASGNVVYNNTIYGNLANQTWAGGLLVYGDGAAGSFVNNTFENNMSVGNSSPQLNAFGGAENDGVNGYGNVYAHNDFGPAAANFIKWGSSTEYSTLTAWQAASSQGINLSVNPLFTNPGAGDFTLQSGSAAIGAGVDIPGSSTANPPNIGAK